MTIEAVVFNLYGTLLKIPNSTRPMERFLIEAQPKSSKYASVISLTKDFSSFEELGRKFSSDSKLIRKYGDILSKEIQRAVLYDDTLPVLQKLRSQGFKIGIISNLASPYKQPFFSTGLDRIVDRYVFSCEFEKKKPDIEIFGHMIQALGVAPEQSVMVGDQIVSDYRAAKKTGMHALLLDRSGVHNEPNTIASLDRVFEYLNGEKISE